MTDVKKMFDDAFEEQHKNDNKPAAEETKPTEVATETVAEQSSGEGGGAKAKEQETAQAPAIDLSLLSQTIGYEVKDIEELKGAFSYKKKVSELEDLLSQYDSVAQEGFDVTKHVSLETLKAEKIISKIPVSFDKARALAKGEQLSDIDYLTMGYRMDDPETTLGEAELKDAMLEEYGIEEDDLSDMSRLSSLKRMKLEKAIKSAKKQVDGVLSEAGNVNTSSFGYLMEKRKVGMAELQSKIEEEYKPFAEKVVQEFKSIKVPTESGVDFEFQLPADFSEGMADLIVSNAKSNGKLLDKESATNVYTQLHAIAWSTYGTKIAEAYGKHMYSEAMKDSDIKYANPNAGIRSVENADAGAGAEQREVHQFLKRPESQWTKKTN